MPDTGDGGVHLCLDCDEVVEDSYRYHASCCPHEGDDVEDVDDRDGEGGRLFSWCHGCGREVIPEQDEDGVTFVLT